MRDLLGESTRCSPAKVRQAGKMPRSSKCPFRAQKGARTPVGRFLRPAATDWGTARQDVTQPTSALALHAGCTIVTRLTSWDRLPGGCGFPRTSLVTMHQLKYQALYSSLADDSTHPESAFRATNRDAVGGSFIWSMSDERRRTSSWRLSVAPMMDWTLCSAFMRVIARSVAVS